MSLSKRYLSCHKRAMRFDVGTFGKVLRDACPEVILAFLMGSSKDGYIALGGDIDVALYVNDKPTFDLRVRVLDIVERFAPGVHGDIGFLNNVEPVYRFEALKSRLLFTRDQETYLNFFSLTCREYESQIFDYKKQYQYRIGAA